MTNANGITACGVLARAVPAVCFVALAACTGASTGGDNAPLYAAIDAGDTLNVAALLEGGADPNSRTVARRVGERTRPGTRGAPPPLIHAIAVGNATNVRLLLARGARADITDDDGFTPLELAVDRGDSAMVRALLSRGGNPRSNSKHGFPLLFVAAGQGRGDVIGLLVSAGAPVDGRDENGLAVAHYHGTSTESAFERLKGGGEPKVQPGATALMLAAQQGHQAAVRALLANGADHRATDAAGRTALMLVSEAGVSGSPEPRVVETGALLLQHGADPQARDAAGHSAVDRVRALAGMSPTQAELLRFIEARRMRAP